MRKKYQIRNIKSETQKSLPREAKRSGGFTVLESIVAIFVLSLAISGAFAAVRQGLSQTTMAKEEVKAFYLAQEATEIIRNQRDLNRLASINSGRIIPWLAGIAENSSDPCYFGKTCKVNAVGPGGAYLFPCSGGWDSCDKLRQDQNTFIYSYDLDDPESNFKREVQIEWVSDNEISVTVRVSWSKGIINREFKVKTQLFNWF